MFIRKGMNRQLVQTLFFVLFLQATNLILVAQNQIVVKPIIVLDDEIIGANNFIICNKNNDLNTVDSLYIKCIAEQLIVFKMNTDLTTIDVYWNKKTTKDTLYFTSKITAFDFGGIEQLHLKGLPLKWIKQNHDINSIKETTKKVNSRLAIFDLGELGYRFYSNSDKEKLTLKWFLRNKTKSYIDFVAGFGNTNSNNVGVFGQGKMELNHVLSPFSKTLFQFERLSQRNSIISLNHKQLERVFNYGPNQVFVHLSQRDSLFRRNEVEIAWDFFQSNNFMYSLSIFSQAATVSSVFNQNSAINSGNHSSRGLGLTIAFNTINFQRWFDLTTYGFQAKFDQFIKSYEPNNTNLQASKNTYLTRVNLTAKYYKPLWKSNISLYTKIHLYAIPANVNLSAAEVINTGGLNSIRAYLENQFFAKDAAIINIENRFRLDRESYFFLFADAARLNINQEIIGSSATNWVNEGRWQNLLSGGAGIRIFGENIQTQAVVAFSGQSSLLNPRIHIGIIRLF